MAKWKCEICGNEFDNFHAQGFDNKIYCPLCYFKKENQKLKGKIKKLSQWDINKDTRNSRQRVANAKLLKEIKQLKKQQKKFMKWLESVKFIGIIPIEIVCDKYKEIIGDDK